MPTQTLVQRLNPGDQSNATVMHRREVETFISNGSFSAGDWVQFDTSKTNEDRCLYVIKCVHIATGAPLCVGVALDAATAAGQLIRVVVSGYVEGANVVTGAVTGDSLTCLTTDGRAGVSTAATFAGTACGVAYENSAANTGDVWVLKRF